MKNKICLLMFVMAGLMTSCGSDESSEPDNSAPEISDKPIFTAETDDFGDTRTSLGTYNRILWTDKDYVTIFPKNSLGDKYQLVSGAETQNGSFKYISSGSFSSGAEYEHNAAVYPYSSDYMMSKASETSYRIDNVVFPAEQTYVENSFSQGAMPMVAVTETNNLKFKNVGGLLKLNIKAGSGEVRINKIILESRSEVQEVIAGRSVVTVGYDGLNPMAAINGEGSKKIMLNCNSIKLSGTNATTFYVALPAIDFPKGFVINIYDEALNNMTLRAKACSIKRNQILTMPTITYRSKEIQDIEPGGYVPDMPLGN